MPFIDFRATNINRAFILNAFATSLIAIVTIEAKNLLDENEVSQSEYFRAFLAFASGFLSALIIYWVMYFFFGFGGGMLAGSEPIKSAFQNV